MKKIFIFLSVIAVSCSCSKDAMQRVDEPEYIDVSVRGLIDNIELVSESPLVRSCNESYDAYGIQISTGEYGTYPYYSGLYDDISLCKTIKLVRGERYHINSVYIPNAKKYQPYIGRPGNYPFCPWPSEDTHKFPKFEFNKDYYNSEVAFDGFSHQLLGCGYNGNTRDVDYYVYTNDNYVAEVDKPLDINYTRYNADITINLVKGNTQYNKVKVTAEDNYYNKVVTLSEGSGQYVITNHMLFYLFEEEEMRIIVASEDGKDLFYDGKICFKRNKNREYTLTLNPKSSDTDVTVSFNEYTNDNEDMGTL